MVALIGALRWVAIRIRGEALPLVEIAMHLGNIRGLISFVILGISNSVAIVPRILQLDIFRCHVSYQIWYCP